MERQDTDARTPNPDFCLPYFDQVLEKLDQGNTDYAQAWGRHAHWGFWDHPATADGSLADYVLAADAFSQQHCQAAGLADGMTVLDAGCGFGGHLGLINQHYHGMRMVGINIDPRQVARANALVQPQQAMDNQLSFEVANAIHLPFGNNSFDTVFALECIFHFPSRKLFFEEAFRVLKPGGRLVVSDFLCIPPMVPLATLSMKLVRRNIESTSGYCLPPLSLRGYHRLAHSVGLCSMPSRNITTNALPTVAIFKGLLANQGAFAERMAKVYARMGVWMRLGVMDYIILPFYKP